MVYMMKTQTHLCKAGEFYFDEANIVRWVSNNRVPPKDILSDLAFQGRIGLGQMALCQKASDKETSAFLEDYRKNFVLTDEMRADARGAFGPGVDLVNLATGESWRT